MNKNIKRLLQGLLFVLIIIGFIYIGKQDFTKEIVDNEKFDSEYVNVNSDNVFKYVNAQDVYTKMKNGNIILFMGFPSNKWSGYYANILNQAAKESGINEILYYDFKTDRDNKNATYQSIVLKLSNYVSTLDDGTQDIFAPTLVIIKKGKIIAFDNETAINIGNIKPDDYWNEYRSGIKLNNFKTMFNEYLNN
ncbi:MAG: hypothetical protein E7163_05275 [Firmicutes bacterium]|nr:hypothetical protein [Bacillota bacterium]